MRSKRFASTRATSTGLEQQSCEEIFEERERQYRDCYEAFSSLAELGERYGERYGDRSNRRIYVMSRDVEGRWLDLHHAATGAPPPID